MQELRLSTALQGPTTIYKYIYSCV